jgi:hypothetical protein
MSTAIALNIPSKLPANFARMLSTPSEAKVEQLFWHYKSEDKRLVETLTLFKDGRLSCALNLLLRSSKNDHNELINCSINGASYESANKILQQEYWQKALNLTDVMYHMPTNRRYSWRESIKNFDFPVFNLDNLISTLSTLLMERDMFVAERVDGVFKALSKSHITNEPQGFYKRMILANVHNGGSANSSMTSYITDLRIVVARLTGRKGEDRMSSYRLVETLANNKNTGQWVDVDGGAIRIRVYKKGTAHLEVHPDLAWQFNEILALLYPKAIPSNFRQKPKKTIKEFHLSQNLIGFDVLEHISEIAPAYERTHRAGYRGAKKPNIWTPRYPHSIDKHLREKVCAILRSIGGVELAHYEFEFDYDPSEVLETIYLTGSLPDYVSHQFYETPDALAQRAAGKLNQLKGSRILEPSAGQGSLAKHLKGDITCIEVSALHCKILALKGFSNVIQADFLKWAETARISGTTFNKILMNPPYSQGRATAHLDAAFSLLEKAGTMISITTIAVANRFVPDGFTKDIEPLEREDFKGVSVELCIMTLTPNAQ